MTSLSLEKQKHNLCTSILGFRMVLVQRRMTDLVPNLVQVAEPAPAPGCGSENRSAAEKKKREMNECLLPKADFIQIPMISKLSWWAHMEYQGGPCKPAAVDVVEEAGH